MMEKYGCLLLFIVCCFLICGQCGAKTLQHQRSKRAAIAGSGFFRKVQAKFRVGYEKEFSLERTIYLSVYYDQDAGKLAIIRDTAMGERKTYIYDSATGERLEIDNSTKSCVVNDLGADSEDLTLLSFLPGSKIPLTKNLDLGKFLLFGNIEETQINPDQKLEASILSTAWTSMQKLRIGDSDNECPVSHYVTKPDEVETPECNIRRDFLCPVTLVAIIVMCEKPLFIVTDVIDLQETITDPEVFVPPRGVFCARKSQVSLPDLPNQAIKFDVEETEGEETKMVKKWLDSENKLLRTDFIEVDFGEELGRFRTLITDFKNGNEYEIEHFSGSCKVNALDKSSKFPSVENALWGAEVSTADAEIQHIGTRKCRNGANCTAWAVRKKDELKELYFIDDFILTEDMQVTSGLVPAFAHLSPNTDNPVERNIFDFETFYPTFGNVFDVSSCFSESKRVPLQFVITGSMDQLYESSSVASFVDFLAKKLREKAKLTNILQFSDMKINPVSDSQATVTCSLLDISENSKTKTSFKVASSNLEKAFRAPWSLSYPLWSNGNSKMTEFHIRMTKIGGGVVKENDSSGNKLYTPGTMAGMVILGLMIGSLLGIGIMFFVVRKTSVDQFFGRLITNSG